MGRLGTHKDVEKLARQARKAGWQVELTKSNHIRWTPPDGQEHVISGLTTSSRGRANMVAMLRRRGLAV